MREASIGPEPEFLYAEKEYNQNDKTGMPNHLSEIEHFKAPGKLVEYKFFDSKRLVKLKSEDEKQVLIFDNEAEFAYEIFDYTKFLSCIAVKERMSSFVLVVR